MNTAPANQNDHILPHDSIRQARCSCQTAAETLELIRAKARRLLSDIMNLLIKFSWWYFIGILGVSRTDWSDAVGK